MTSGLACKVSLASLVSAQVSDKLLSAADVPMMEYRFFGVLARDFLIQL